MNRSRHSAIGFRPAALGLAALCAVLGTVLWTLLALPGAASAQDRTTLVSIATDAPPALDGTMDAAWSKAAPLQVELSDQVYTPSNGYKGLQKAKITVRSMHDAENVYFLLQWDDPTPSLDYQPWVKQADGSWKRQGNPDSSDHENTFAEDKVALIWDINAAGFEQRGCTVLCHKARGGRIAGVADKSPGRKYTNKPGETVDLWIWESVRTNPVGQLDDWFIDDTSQPAKNPEWGRKPDASSGGGYAENVNAAKNAPGFMNKDPAAANKTWVLDAEKADFADSFKAGDTVGGEVLAPFTGSRGDLSGVGKHANGAWTVEVKRKLVTGGDKTQDVQFGNLKQTYYFGVSVFDNTEIDHLYHQGALKLVFK